MALSRRSRERGIDYWPGFVDALSTLLLVFIFLLSVFVLGQFFISREIAGKEDVLQKLTRRLSELTDILALERSNRTETEQKLLSLNATLNAEKAARGALEASLAESEKTAQQNGGGGAQLLESERERASRALREVTLLNQQINAMREQLQALQNALGAAETREQDAQLRISELGSRLNVALAQRVQELNKYRSEFFGRLRDILGNRPDVRIAGDRFVFQSEVLFATGANEIEANGKAELDSLALALIELERQIPPDINWIARIDGHTDKRPFSGIGVIKDNWDLSTARALAVVRYLANKGVSPQRLVAAGFGEFAPIDFGDTPEALARNRRIELKLTER